MPTEAEKRMHRCCFSGHRLEKLTEDEATVKSWLRTEIESAIASGYTTFITGCAMGVDIWAAQIVLDIRTDLAYETGSSNIHLIAATPWPGFSNRWSPDWQVQYSDVLKAADLVVPVSNHYSKDVFQRRNEWMVDHSNRLIAYYNGMPGGAKDTIDYALNKGIEVITNNPDYTPKKKREPKADEPPKMDYPENIIRDIGLTAVFGKEEYIPLTADQLAGLDHVIEMLPEKERTVLRLHYRDKQTLQACGNHFGFTRQRAQQIGWHAIKKLRHPSRIAFIRDGFEKAELAEKIQCAEEMKNLLRIQKKRYPLMNEEDVVKFVFQGMLGSGHLIRSQDETLVRLHSEMETLEPNPDEPLTERLSPEWFRLNLRAAKAKGIKEEDIVYWFFNSASRKPLSFTRQNIYNFCVKLDGSEMMRQAAARVLDGNWLPSHSEQYRNAYHPAYRVLHKDFRKFRREAEE